MVEDDGQQSGICVQWDYYWMKQWGVLGYLACPGFIVLRQVV